MNTRAQAVIGAGYGDEGKGMLVDRLAAATRDTTVVRSNGGAQAGHTVVSPDGRRHVFHHVGSGSFAGAATHFNRFFVAHPMLLLDELAILAGLGLKPRLSSDPRALVTTPYDVIINQAVELMRGNARHGSCGLGFGETIERSLHTDFALMTQDLFRPDLAERLAAVRDLWVPQRLAALGITELPLVLAEALGADATLLAFVADCQAYLDCVSLWPDRRLQDLGPIVFEAAQGLMLDQDYGVFPHVTRSKTGLPNMLAIAAEAKIAGLDVVYATRCYATRHGAGPLRGETDAVDGITVIDPTNAPNAWQGTLRVAPLDLQVLRDAVAHDLSTARQGVNVTASLAVTCLDQAEGAFPLTDDGSIYRVEPTHAAHYIAEAVGLPLRFQCRSPGRLQPA